MINEIFTRPIQTEERKHDLYLNLLRKRGNSKTYKGWLISKMKEARDSKNFDVCELLQTCYHEYCNFETSDAVKFESWKSKSGIKIFNQPDKIIIIRHQKKEKEGEPVEIKTEILKADINDVIVSINKINKLNDKKEKIESSVIASTTYQEEWKDIFSNRSLHIQFTHILGILEFYGLIKYYRSGKVMVLKSVREIQEILPNSE